MFENETKIDSVIEVTTIFLEKGKLYGDEVLQNFHWKKDLDETTFYVNDAYKKFIKKEKLNKLEMVSLNFEKLEKYEEKKQQLKNGYDLVEALEDNIGFQFSIFSDGTDLECPSGMDYETSDDVEYALKGYFEQFEKKAREELEKRLNPKPINGFDLKIDMKEPNFYPYIKYVVRFFTVWEHHSTKDYWSGDYDTWFELVGYLNFQDIRKIVKDEREPIKFVDD